MIQTDKLKTTDMDGIYKDRKTLKSYFRKGDVPTEEQFSALIDSVPNISEDGEVKVSPDDGIRLSPKGTSRTVATIYASEPRQDGVPPLWQLVLGEADGLEIRDGGGNPVLTIDREKNVTVAGRLKAAGYLSAGDGKEESPERDTLKIRADGNWHDLPVEAAAGTGPEGCRVYRISAFYKNLRDGRYSVCEAAASHSGGRKRRIRSSCRHWWGWSGHIKVRWRQADGKLYLQVRSKSCNLGAETILCRVERLWEL